MMHPLLLGGGAGGGGGGSPLGSVYTQCLPEFRGGEGGTGNINCCRCLCGADPSQGSGEGTAFRESEKW